MTNIPPPYPPQAALPAPPHPAGLLTDQRPQQHSKVLLWAFLLALLVVAALGIIARIHAETTLKKKTDANAVPVVTVQQVEAGPALEEVILPGNVQAWHDATIYARTSGYLKQWLVDIGAQVKQNQLLAVIEAPDTDAQTRQAQADLATSEANNALAQVSARRWQNLVKSDSVSQQDADTKTAAAAADQATVASSRANLQHLQQLTDFENVIAPFDGTITARYTDTGALINAGNATGQSLFQIAETDKLRVYVQVPETYAGSIKPDLVADVYFAEHPNHPFPAILASTAEAIDPTARTLLVQLEMDNKDDYLLAGSYGAVHLKLPANTDHVHVPANALLFRSAGLQVVTVGEDNKAHLQDITVARDFGKTVEVGSGLTAGQKIIINPPDSTVEGMPVRIATPDEQKKQNDKNKDSSANDQEKKNGDAKNGAPGNTPAGRLKQDNPTKDN